MALVRNFKAQNSKSREISLSWDRPLDDDFNALVSININSIGAGTITVDDPIATEVGFLIYQGTTVAKVSARTTSSITITLSSVTGLVTGAALLQRTTETIIQRRKDSFPTELNNGTIFTQNVAIEPFRAREVIGSCTVSGNILTDTHANFTSSLIGRIVRDSSSYNFRIIDVPSSTTLKVDLVDTLHSGLYVILSDFSQTDTIQIQPADYTKVTSGPGYIQDLAGFLMDVQGNVFAKPHELCNRIVKDADSNSYIILDNTETRLILNNTSSTPNVSSFPGYTVLKGFNGSASNFFFVDNFIDSEEVVAAHGTGLEIDTWYYYTAFTKTLAIGPCGEDFASLDSADSTQSYELSTGGSDFGTLLYNYWPELYRQTDSGIDADGNVAASGTGNLQDLMSIFGAQFDKLFSLVNTFKLQNARKVSDAVLDQFALQLNLNPTGYVIGRDVLRRIANEMIDIYRNKGDKIGIYKFIRAITTWEITNGSLDIDSAILDDVANVTALRFFSPSLGILNTRIYGNRTIIDSVTPTSYDSVSGRVVVPVTTDLSKVKTGDYLDVETILYKILDGITVDPVPNGTYTFHNASATTFTYDSVTGIVQYNSSVNLSAVNPGDVFFDGNGSTFVIIAVDDGSDNVTITTGQTLNTTPGNDAGGSIQQGEKRFVLNAGLSFPLEASAIIRATPDVNVVSSFTPNSYDNITGIVLVPDSVDLSLVQIGDTFVDASLNEFEILGDINNGTGIKQFQISANQLVDLGAGAVIDRIASQGSGRFLKQLPGIIIPGFFSFREFVVFVPKIAMFIDTFNTMTVSNGQATITFNGSPNFGAINGLKDCILYPNQSIIKESFKIVSNTSNTITVDGVPKFATNGDTSVVLTQLNSSRFQSVSNLLPLVSPYNTKGSFSFTDPISVPIS